MGVMLALEGTRQGRSRRRRGQHSRTTDDQACLDALAAFLRSDATSAGRYLSRVSKAGLAARLLPAARALVQAADLVLAERPAPARSVEIDYVLYPARLPGMRTAPAVGDPGTTSACASLTCQHSSHLGRSALRTYSAEIARRAS